MFTARVSQQSTTCSDHDNLNISLAIMLQTKFYCWSKCFSRISVTKVPFPMLPNLFNSNFSFSLQWASFVVYCCVSLTTSQLKIILHAREIITLTSFHNRNNLWTKSSTLKTRVGLDYNYHFINYLFIVVGRRENRMCKRDAKYVNNKKVAPRTQWTDDFIVLKLYSAIFTFYSIFGVSIPKISFNRPNDK